MIDIHTHLLPGLDNGPRTLSETLSMCRTAVADGITLSVLTPHMLPGRWDNTAAGIARRCQQLQLILEHEGIPLKLAFAAEVRLGIHLQEQIRNGEVPFLGKVGNESVLLLELPHSGVPGNTVEMLNWLQRQRIRPLLAHPERNRQLMQEPETLEPLIRAGCWLQLTAGSLSGRFGQASRCLAETLIDSGAVTAIASDAHDTGMRPPVLSTAHRIVARRFGRASARRLFHDNPADIVERDSSNADLGHSSVMEWLAAGSASHAMRKTQPARYA